MKSIFDDPELDASRHCERGLCRPQPIVHIIAFKGIKPMPWPQSLHVRAVPGGCACRCEACLKMHKVRRPALKAAVLKAYEAWKAGTPIYDPKCHLCPCAATSGKLKCTLERHKPPSVHYDESAKMHFSLEKDKP